MFLMDEEFIIKVFCSLYVFVQLNQFVQVSRDYLNLFYENNNEGVQVYVKFVVLDWIYFIRQFKVNIGCCFDFLVVFFFVLVLVDIQGSLVLFVVDDNVVYVDFGFSKMILRLYVVIYFDGDQEVWCLMVKGCNVFKVDGIFWRNG